jgi:cell division protein FtsB
MKKLLYLLIIIISVLIVNNLIRSTYNLWQKHDLITQAEKQLSKQKIENDRLKDQLARVKRADFIEEEARNKLFMVKPGEKVVLMGETEESPGTSGTKSTPKHDPVYKQWWNVFFKEKS